MPQPTLLVFAGPNGSGKSTITQGFTPVGYYVNADDIQRLLKCEPLDAAKKATDTREELLKRNESFTFETVLSTDRNLKLMQAALAKGYVVICIYILTRDPSINVRRVEQRVKAGGHCVEPEKIITRYKRAMQLIPALCNSCSKLQIFDNSMDRTESDPSLIAEINEGEITAYPSAIWPYEDILLLLSGKYIPDANRC